MGSDSPSLRLRRVLVVEALPDADGTGPERLGVNRTSRRRRAQFVPNTTTNSSRSEPTAANVPSHARETPWSQDPPDTSSKLVIRQTLLGRSTSQLRETGHGGGLVSVSSRFSSRFSSQLPSFASVRRASGVTLSCGQAGNTPERPGSRVGKRVGLTATVTATWLRRDRSAVNLSVQLAPSTDCHGLWDRPGPDLRICECC